MYMTACVYLYFFFLSLFHVIQFRVLNFRRAEHRTLIARSMLSAKIISAKERFFENTEIDYKNAIILFSALYFPFKTKAIV